MKNVLGIIFSNMHEYSVSALTGHRCMGSIPVGGRYRIIDFVLSGFTNAGIRDVGVITKSNYQSLMDHVGNGLEWDLVRKRGGLAILPPFGDISSNTMYRGRVEALSGIMGYIKKSRCEYAILADCDLLANIDYSKFIRTHLESGADITVMCKKMVMQPSSEENKDTYVFALDQQRRVLDMLIHPQISGEQNVYLNVMMLSKKLLEYIIQDCVSHNYQSFNRDVLLNSVHKYDMRAYEVEGHVRRFDSVKSYLDANLELLQRDVRHALFPRERPVYTKLRDEAPVRYGLDAKVGNSLIGDGSVIEGQVENSILFRGVKVEKGAVVKNSILMQDTHVGIGSRLDYVIADKNVIVENERTVMGFATYPVYIFKGTTV